MIGRSSIVGKPMAHLLLQANATVTVCHSRTKDLAEHTLEADVLVAAVGVPAMVTPDMVKPGGVVVDVGINRTDDGLVGDVDPGAAEVASHLTPVPGRRRADDDRAACCRTPFAAPATAAASLHIPADSVLMLRALRRSADL